MLSFLLVCLSVGYHTNTTVLVGDVLPEVRVAVNDSGVVYVCWAEPPALVNEVTQISSIGRLVFTDLAFLQAGNITLRVSKNSSRNSSIVWSANYTAVLPVQVDGSIDNKVAALYVILAVFLPTTVLLLARYLRTEWKKRRRLQKANIVSETIPKNSPLNLPKPRCSALSLYSPSEMDEALMSASRTTSDICICVTPPTSSHSLQELEETLRMI